MSTGIPRADTGTPRSTIGSRARQIRRVGLRVVGVVVLIGIPLGLVMAAIRPLRTAIEPLVGFVRSLPPLAYFSLLIIWFGIEDRPDQE